jgi:hypothetical protein
MQQAVQGVANHFEVGIGVDEQSAGESPLLINFSYPEGDGSREQATAELIAGDIRSIPPAIAFSP